MRFSSILLLATRYMKNRKVASIISITAIGLSLVFLIGVGSVNFAIKKTAVEGAIKYPLIIGPDNTSGIQTLMSTIFHLERPSGLIPFEVYEEVKKDDRVIAAFPMAVSHSVKNFPIIGVNEDYIKNFGVETIEGEIDLTDKRNAVLGFAVAKKTGARLGHEFYASHGAGKHGEKLGEHKHIKFKVVGVLKPTGGPSDAAVYVSFQSIWDLHNHSNPAQAANVEKNACDEAGNLKNKYEATPDFKDFNKNHVILGETAEVTLPKDKDSYVHFTPRMPGRYYLFMTKRLLHEVLNEDGDKLPSKEKGACKQCRDKYPFIYFIHVSKTPDPHILHFKALKDGGKVRIFVRAADASYPADAGGHACLATTYLHPDYDKFDIATPFEKFKDVCFPLGTAQQITLAGADDGYLHFDAAENVKYSVYVNKPVLEGVYDVAKKPVKYEKVEKNDHCPNEFPYSYIIHVTSAPMKQILHFKGKKGEKFRVFIRRTYETKTEAAHDAVQKKNISQGTLTAVLVTTKNPAFTGQLEREWSVKSGTMAIDTGKTMKKLIGYMNKAEDIIEIFSSITLLIVILMILVTMIMSLEERKKELALMRSLGIGRFSISLIIAMESFILTAAGALVGVVLGHGLLWYFENVINSTLNITIEPFTFTAMELEGIIITLVIAQLLTLFSMIWTYRLNLVEEIAKG